MEDKEREKKQKDREKGREKRQKDRKRKGKRRNRERKDGQEKEIEKKKREKEKKIENVSEEDKKFSPNNKFKENCKNALSSISSAPVHGTEHHLNKFFQSNHLEVYLITRVVKMKTVIAFLVIFSLIYVVPAADYRGIFGNWFGGGAQSPCSGCPFRNCLNDRAVIYGYCCGCARVSDFLPIDCPGLRINCPADGRRLCRDYDYMLNCCCP